MNDWLFLLLPVAAASGWFAARRHFTKKYPLDHSQTLRSAYCRGLNYLLSEKTDKAIDTFADLLVNDFETIETHIALGNLFRRRGEMEKAIEIHENLLNKAQLNEQQRTGLHFELGMDYLRAGLFDRAENIFKNLLDKEAHRKSSLQQLLQIYQHEKEWRKALECAHHLQIMGKIQRHETVGQFLCELAEEKLTAHCDDEATEYLAEALREDPRCVRATLLLVRLKMRQGLFEEALQTIKQVESQNSAYLTEILEPLRICHERLNRPTGELLGYLGYLYETYGVEGAALALADVLRTERGAGRAVEHLQRVLDAHPSLRATNTLTGLLLEDGAEIQRDALLRLDRALGRLTAGSARYRCVQCGFSGMELHWRCPSCRNWESTRPIG